MDEVRIESDFGTIIVGKLIEHYLKKRLGCDIDVDLKALNMKYVDEKVYFTLNLKGEATKTQILKMLQEGK